MKSKLITSVIIISVVFICIVASCGNGIRKGIERREVVGTVTDKGVKRSDKEDKYLIYTKDDNGEPQVYEVTDNFLAFRFDSSNDYASIEVGKTYKFTVGGSRNTFLSWYPNIYEFEEIVKE